MPPTVARSVAVALLAAAAATLAVAVFLPWYAIGSEVDGDAEWDEHAPFRRDVDAPEDEFVTQTVVLGGLVAGAGVAAVAGLVLAVMALRRQDAATGAVVALALATTLLAGAAVAYTYVAFPDEANRVHGRSDLEFDDRECRFLFGVEFCILTGPRMGWWIGWAGAVVPLPAAYISRGPRGARPPRPARAPPASSERTGAVPPAPPVRGPGIPPGTTRVVKCPQCQTRLSFTVGPRHPRTRECHNCGRRVDVTG